MSTTGTAVPTIGSTGSDPSAPAPSLVMRLHFYAGILVAPFIFLAALTGGLYALAPTIEGVVYSDLIQTNSAGPSMSVAEQVAAARGVMPTLVLDAVRPSAEPGETTRVMFTDPTLGESERRAVFIDPVTATSVGDSVVYGSSNALPLRTWISGFHRHLHLGEPGRIYSELAASWMWIVALGGVVLWVRRYRRGGRLLTVDRSDKGRARTRNWHGGVGIWIAIGLVLLSATGLTWSKYTGENITELRAALSWTTPAIAKSISGGTPASAGDHAGHDMVPTASEPDVLSSNVGRIDSVLGTARANGIDGKVEVSIPPSTDTAFVVSQTRQPWVLSTSSIAIDGATNSIVDTNSFAEWPLAAKLSAWGIALHMGILFGLANQIALAVLAGALVTVIVRGYLMWWKRRPISAAPPARGSLARLPKWQLASIAAASILLGWYIPLLGISLLAFLALDVVLGLRRRTTLVESL